jgi:hypothetical protein
LRAGEPTLIPAERVRTALETAGSRRQGCGPWQCPAHDDRQASLSVKEGRGGRVLLHCHAGCETQDVLAALSLDWADLFPGDRNGKARAEIVATYDYTDADGHLLYQTVRYFPKAFKRRRPDGNGGWTWSLQGVQQVLYRLPRVLAAVAATEPVYVVEGEKDVHAVERAGATATTVLGGVNGTWPPEFSRLLAKTCTVVVADDDDPGRQRARRIAASIGEHGGQVELVGPVTGKDASDHLAAGKTLADFLPLDAQAAVDVAVDGAELLEEVYGALERYVVFPSGEAAVAVTLWVAASHAQPAWEHATRMVVKSPLKRCGKTRLLDVLEALSHNALPTVNISVAALVRSIDEADPPTLLLDEADTIFVRRRGERAEAAEDLRGILNAGHRRGRPYIRWDQAARAVERCPTFAMAVLAAIGDLPDTIEDRAVVVAMRRRAPGESVSALRRRDLPELAELAQRLHGWVRANLAALTDSRPAMPVEDRAADCWEPLVAVAELAGADWPDLARGACRNMAAAAAADEDGSLGERLLTDLQAVFRNDERLESKAIVQELHAVEEAPWADLYGTALDARRLAKLLRPYGVRPKVLRMGETTARGYERADLLDPWRRYVRNERNQRNNAGQGVTDAAVLPQHDAERNAPTSDVTDVADVMQVTAGDGRLPGVDPRNPGRFRQA